MDPNPVDVTNLLGTLGPYGFIAALLWYTMRSLIPKMLERFETQIREERDVVAKSVREIMVALNENLRATQFLIAKLTQIEEVDLGMEQLMCPHDGKTCSDQEKQRIYQEHRASGRETGPVRIAARDLETKDPP